MPFFSDHFCETGLVIPLLRDSLLFAAGAVAMQGNPILFLS
jgi:hypothetical protein